MGMVIQERFYDYGVQIRMCQKAKFKHSKMNIDGISAIYNHMPIMHFYTGWTY